MGALHTSPRHSGHREAMSPERRSRKPRPTVTESDTPFDPELIKFSLGSNFAALCAAKVKRDGHLVVKLEMGTRSNLPSDWTYPSTIRVSAWLDFSILTLDLNQKSGFREADPTCDAP